MSTKKKATKKKAATKKPATAFYQAGRASNLGPKRQFHILLSEDDHSKLVKLTQARSKNAADVIRGLIREAKLKAA